MHMQPYKGCPFECNLAEITRNETVWRMRTNNVKRVYYAWILIEYIDRITVKSNQFLNFHIDNRFSFVYRPINRYFD